MQRWKSRLGAITLAIGSLVGCDGDDPIDEPVVDTWQIVHEGAAGALLSVWGTSARDVWVVGADALDGSGPVVLHLDGDAWQRVPTGLAQGDLWWVFGFEGGPVYMGGTGGTILRYQPGPGDGPADGSFTVMPTPGLGTVFGIWGATPDDVWAVGGTGLAVHWDGCGWKQQQPSFTSATLLSVYVAPRATGQTTPSQAWALDDTNSIWRFDGASWAKEFQLPATPTGRLAAIHGSSGTDVWAVGTGLIQMGTSMVPSGCIIYHSNGQEWQAGNYCAGPATNIKTYSLNYVYAIDGQSAVAAGGASATQKVGFYKVGAWAPAPPLTMDSGGDASAIWASSAGDVWVGGPASLLHHYAGTTGQWTPDNSLQAGMSTNEFVYRLWGTAATDVWAISFAPGLGKSRLFRYKGSWQQQTLTSPYAVVAGWSASSSDVWLVGYGAVRIHFDGQSFTEFR